MFVPGGGWYLLGIQALSCLCLTTWGIVTSIILLWCINKVVTIRMELHMELMGADLTEHNIKHGNVHDANNVCSSTRTHNVGRGCPFCHVAQTKEEATDITFCSIGKFYKILV